MPDIPFAYRVAALLILFVVAALVDRVRLGGMSVRWAEYLTILIGGIAGAVYGAINDAMTVTLSPEYFVIGKELDNSPELFTDAVILGAQAGFSAGIVLAAVHVYFMTASRWGSPGTPWNLVQRMPRVIETALALSVAGALSMHQGADAGALPDLYPLTVSQATDFYTVWGIHLGAYAGALMASIWNIRRIVRDRRTR